MLPSDTPVRKLPYYVEPAADEALISWLLRLATQMDISMQTLIEDVLGMDHGLVGAHWWRRPHPSLLKMISGKTGVSIERLRQMTLTTWAPPYLDDEADGRFSHRQYERPGTKWSSFRFVGCPQCLKADRRPYVRLSWEIGWTAVCPNHAGRLVTHCTRCRTRMRSSGFSWLSRFRPLTCVGCANPLSFDQLPAHPSVIRLQEALLRAKREGRTEVPSLGKLSWRELVALADILIGMFGAHPGPRRKKIYLEGFDRAFNVSPAVSTYDRYSGLALLTWLTADWPTGCGARIGRRLLEQWFTGKPLHRSCSGRHVGIDWTNPFDPLQRVIELEVRTRLQQLL